MKKKVKTFGLIIVFLVGLNYAWAEDKSDSSAIDLPTIVITPTKTEELAGQSACSINVVEEGEIEAKGAKTVFEAIEGIPGLDVVETGGFGGDVSVYIRGANSEHVLVMVDGIEMNDPMKATRSFNFANLTTDNIDRIEVLRGPQSTLYGSDALGGVINIITKEGKGKPKCSVLTEVGSYETYRQRLELTGSSDRFNYSLFVSHLDSDGISKATEGKEEDGYENTTVSTRLGIKLINDARLDFVMRYINADIDLDGYDYANRLNVDDPNYTSKNDTRALKLKFEQPLFKWWEHTLSVSSLNIKRKNRNFPDALDTTDYYDWYKGIDRKIEWQHNFFLEEVDTITAGFEYNQEKGEAYGFDKRSLENKAYYLQNQLKLWKKLFITTGIRTDDHEEFGTDTNYRFTCAYLLDKFGTKFKGSWATGFKAPSLYQLYSTTYGDPNLLPEEVRSYDIGIEQALLGNKITTKITYFYNKFEQLIEWDWATYKYKNVGRVRTKGAEIEMGIKPFEKLNITGTYTYLNGKNLSTGKELCRRPKKKCSISIDYRPIKKAGLNFSVNYIGRHWDDLAMTVKRKPHAKVNFAGHYDLRDNFQIFGRIENLFDKDYDEVYGFESPGISFYGGGKTSF